MADKLGLMLVLINDNGVYPTNRIYDIGDIAKEITTAVADAVVKAFDPNKEVQDD